MASPTSRYDTSDVDRWISVPIGGGEIIEDIHVDDIRRWVGDADPKPLHYDEASTKAAASADSRAAGDHDELRLGHGAEPAIAGVVPSTRMLFSSDDRRSSARVAPSDVFPRRAVLLDYRVRDTAFAPTIFSRSDHSNQRQELVASGASTSIRCLAEEAQKRREGGRWSRVVR